MLSATIEWEMEKRHAAEMVADAANRVGSCAENVAYAAKLVMMALNNVSSTIQTLAGLGHCYAVHSCDELREDPRIPELSMESFYERHPIRRIMRRMTMSSKLFTRGLV